MKVKRKAKTGLENIRARDASRHRRTCIFCCLFELFLMMMTIDDVYLSSLIRF